MKACTVHVQRSRSFAVKCCVLMDNYHITSNRKSYMRFRFTPRSMTLNCYKVELTRNFTRFCRFGGQQWQKRMKIDLYRYCQQRNC